MSRLRSRSVWAFAAWIFAVLSASGLMAGSVQVVSAQAVPVGVVNTPRLNVRDYPQFPTGNVIAQVSEGEVYTITARSSLSYWLQIRLVDGRLGWVNGIYLDVFNPQLIPTIDPGPPPVAPPVLPVPATGIVTAYFLNVRAIPDPINGAILARVQRNEVYPVVGRNANSSWWQIRLGSGVLGWVNGGFLSVSNAAAVPVTDNSVPPGTVTATATVTAFFLNVRDQPSAVFGRVLRVVSQGESFTVIGRNASASWWQVRLPDGTSGWVSGSWVSTVNVQNVPVTY